MRTTVALIVAIALTLGIAGGALAQGTQGPGATTGQGSGTAPGAKSAADPSMPPTTGEKIPPVSVNPGAPVTPGRDVTSATGAGTPKSP